MTDYLIQQRRNTMPRMAKADKKNFGAWLPEGSYA